MTLSEDVFGTLSTDEGIADLVAGRIYPRRRPARSVLPCVVYNVLARDPVNSQSGASNLENPRLVVDCYARTVLECEQLAQAVRAAVPALGLAALVVGGRQDFDSESELQREGVDVELWRRDR